MFAAATGATVGVASVLANAQPLLVILPPWWLFGERPRLLEVVAVTVGFGGLVLVAAPSRGGRGAGLALLAAVAITAGTLLARRLARSICSCLARGSSCWEAPVLQQRPWVSEGPPTGIAWTPRFSALLTTLAVVATALPYVLWFGDLRRASLASVAYVDAADTGGRGAAWRGHPA